ncbi:MAG: GNAT family N-acetyltransferase [Acidobacteriota bacterium]|nr:GNAT family N-acetyltransferase [Acidobacteriota bacterium]
MSQATFTPLESARLILRRFTDADLAAFIAYRNDPLVAKYQSWESYSERQAAEFIRDYRNLEPGVAGTWFQFAVELKATGALIGDCALCVRSDATREAEIGYTLAREYQGRGYATEAVTRLLDYTCGDLGARRVVALTDCRNAASITLLERLGLRREEHFKNVWFKGYWAEEYLYALSADEWRRNRNDFGGGVVVSDRTKE